MNIYDSYLEGELDTILYYKKINSQLSNIPGLSLVKIFRQEICSILPFGGNLRKRGRRDSAL